MLDISKVFDSKKFLNFRIKDLNEDTQKLNIHLYNVSILNLLVFSIASIPIIIFSINFFIDPNLIFYFQKIEELQKYLVLPSKASIFAPLVISWVFILLTLLLIVLIKPFISSNKIKNSYKNVFWIILLCVSIMTFLFAAVSQYEHTIYQDFFNFESRVSENIPSQFEIISAVSKYFTANVENAYIWTTEDGIWWILFAQILMMFMLSLSIQNAIVLDVKQLNIEKYISFYNEKQKELDNSKIKYFFNKVFNTSYKTLAVWTIITAFCILLPSCIYIICISFNTTPIARLSSFLNSFPNLMNRFQGAEDVKKDFTELISYSNKYFNYSSLPVLIIGITFSTLLYFVSISIRGENRSQKTFIIQYYIIVLELFAVLGFSFYSQIEMNGLINSWNKNFVGTTNSTGTEFINHISDLFSNPEDFEKIKNFYKLDSFNKTINIQFLDLVSIICQIIIFSSLLITSFAIIGKSLFNKSNLKNRLVMGLNNAR